MNQTMQLCNTQLYWYQHLTIVNESYVLAHCSLFHRQRVAQVYSEGVRLLDGVHSTEELIIQEAKGVMDTGHSSRVAIEMADIADPYILLRMDDGSVRVLTGGGQIYVLLQLNKWRIALFYCATIL